MFSNILLPVNRFRTIGIDKLSDGLGATGRALDIIYVFIYQTRIEHLLCAR